VEPSSERLEEILTATRHYVNQARDRIGWGPQAVIIVTVPYNPQVRGLFEQAQPILLAENIELDWALWQHWTVNRTTVGDDFDPEPFVVAQRGEYRVIPSPTLLGTREVNARGALTLTPEDARQLAARLLACADAAELAQTAALEGDSSR
jgi:hypothetical protein